MLDPQGYIDLVSDIWKWIKILNEMIFNSTVLIIFVQLGIWEIWKLFYMWGHLQFQDFGPDEVSFEIYTSLRFFFLKKKTNIYVCIWFMCVDTDSHAYEL